MESPPYLGKEDQGGQLPPSSPPVMQPSSPLTMLGELHGPPTVCASSPLSSPPESPTPAPRTHILPTSSMVVELGSEDGFVLSSPVRNCDDIRRKAQKRRDEQRDARTREEQKRRTTVFKECLDILAQNKLTFSELTEYVFFCDNQTANFVNRGLIVGLLNVLSSTKMTRTCQRLVKDWAVSTVLQTIIKEVRAATRSGNLQITEHVIDSSFASGLSFDELKAMVRQHCPTFLGLLLDVITTGRQAGSASKERLAAKEHVSTLFG